MICPILRISAIALLAIAISACDQMPGKGGSGTAVINLGTIAKETGEEEEIQRQAEITRQQLNVQLAEAASRLEGELNAEREKMGENPSQEDQQKFQQLAAQAQQQYQRAQQQAQQQAQQFESNLVLQLRERVKPVAEAVARSRGVSIVFLSDMTLFWAEPQADITQEVLAKLQADPSILAPEPTSEPTAEPTAEAPAAEPATDTGAAQ